MVLTAFSAQNTMKLNKIHPYLRHFFRYYLQTFFPLIIAFIFLRSIEFTFLINKSYTYKNIWRSFSYALEFDAILLAFLGLTVFPLSLFLLKQSSRLFQNFHLIFGSLLILLKIIFTKFFISSNYLMDFSIFSFNWEEIKLILSGEQFKMLSLSTFSYTTGILAWIIFYFISKKLIKSPPTKTLLPILFFSIISSLLIFRLELTPNHNKHFSLYETKLHTSKITHFFKSVFNHYTYENTGDINFIKLSKEYKKLSHQKVSSPYPAFPFYKTVTTNKKDKWDVYFKNRDSLNIVMIYMEGMSSEFVGPNSKYRGGTPFLDSLAQNSLYWPNMLSITDRTHGVFAATLGGLPHGFERGFINLEKYPSFVSVTDLLRQNKYAFNFFYGGDASFDSYERFLRTINFAEVIDKGYQERSII